MQIYNPENFCQALFSTIFRHFVYNTVCQEEINCTICGFFSVLIHNIPFKSLYFRLNKNYSDVY